MNELLKKEIDVLPEKPGCYLMKNVDNEIIYIGKAKNLKKRVSQYFLRPQNGKTQAMVSHVDHFETIVTKSEKEALILEMNLIQKHYPRYNILLMDDKHYPYIALNIATPHPYVSIARHVTNKKNLYFGPYPDSSSAFEVVSIINRLFKLRKCQTIPRKECLYYHINQCLAPCINDIKKEDYDEILKDIKAFLNGDNKKVLKELENKIKYHSDQLDFENANDYKLMYNSILHINEKQNVELNSSFNRDFISFATRSNYVNITFLIYRKGLLIGKKSFIYEIIGELYEFISEMIYQFYLINVAPSIIVVSNKEIKDILLELLDVKIENPTKGKSFEILSNASINSVESLDEHFNTARLTDNNLDILEDLGKLLSIPTPYRIELFDNSHLQGTNAIGAMVCFINGQPNKKMYRKFNLNNDNTKDDLVNMKEVTTRRYLRLKEEDLKMPDLVIIDGGINQINVVKESLNKIGVNIHIAGLSKDSKHRTSLLVTSDNKTIDLTENKKLFFLLTRMQDEVHRYAIKFHSNKRSKGMYNSIFDEVEGIGKYRKEKLSLRYSSINLLKGATLEELEQLLPKNVALNLYNKIKEKYYD